MRGKLCLGPNTASDPSNRLSLWNGNNCCQWPVVGCNNATGHVIRLDLPSELTFSLWSDIKGNELNSSLSELTYLSYLDLSGNNFGRSPVPEFIGTLTRLRHLNLSFAQFLGVVPHQIGNLSSLHVLDLGGNSKIDMHNLYPNVSFIFYISNKRAKHELDSYYLWHCRLGHINKKRMDMLQRDGLLQPVGPIML
ncbi:putative leucine-rich repeat protein [Tanacetum coccineum]